MSCRPHGCQMTRVVSLAVRAAASTSASRSGALLTLDPNVRHVAALRGPTACTRMSYGHPRRQEVQPVRVSPTSKGDKASRRRAPPPSPTRFRLRRPGSEFRSQLEPVVAGRAIWVGIGTVTGLNRPGAVGGSHLDLMNAGAERDRELPDNPGEWPKRRYQLGCPPALAAIHRQLHALDSSVASEGDAREGHVAGRHPR